MKEQRDYTPLPSQTPVLLPQGWGWARPSAFLMVAAASIDQAVAPLIHTHITRHHDMSIPPTTADSTYSLCPPATQDLDTPTLAPPALPLPRWFIPSSSVLDLGLEWME